MMEIAIRDAYGEALLELGEARDDVLVLDADVGTSARSRAFGERFPDRYYNVGIAELNMAGISAGLAMSGFMPFINAFGVFLSTRASDAILNLICHDRLNVKIAGAYGGYSDSYDGESHHALSDLAFFRSAPNMAVISVCDAVETRKAVFAAAKHDGPVYIRLCKERAPVIYDESEEFQIGRGKVLKEGKDAVIIATGFLVHNALEASRLLEREGLSAAVLDIHTVHPLDESLIIEYARRTDAVLTVEEHGVRGGLGGAVAELLGRERPTLMGFAGVEGQSETGGYEELSAKFGLDGAGIAARCAALIERKRRMGV